MIDNDMELERTKYILRFMPEYHSTCLWPENKLAKDAFSMPIAYEELKLSNALIHRLLCFDDQIMNILDRNDPGGPSPMSQEERKALYQEGVCLTRMVKEELGSEFMIKDALDWIKPEHEEG